MQLRPTVLLVAALAASIVAGLAGCAPERIEASGQEASETRDLGTVNSVDLKAPADVTLVQGKDSSVRITADKAAMSYIVTSVSGGVLTITVEDGGREIPVDKDVKIAVEVRSPTFLAVKNGSRGSISSERIAVDAFQVGNYGAGTITVDRLRAVRLACDLGGTGDVKIGSGAAGAQQITLGGAGSYLAPDLESQVAVVTVNGSGDAEIWVTEALDGTVSGTGSVSYWGAPELSAEAAASDSMKSLGQKESQPQ